jgi:hypothetical protein
VVAPPNNELQRTRSAPATGAAALAAELSVGRTNEAFDGLMAGGAPMASEA